MKNFDRETYRLYLADIKTIKSVDPFSIETYYGGILDIANSFNTEEQASGCLDKNDLIQECMLALVEAWDRLDMDTAHAADSPQAYIWAFIKKSVKLKSRERVHDKKDGIRIPHGKRWELNETKDVDDFLTQLFPPDFFAENDEAMGLIDSDGYMIRYDIEQLGLAIEDVMTKNLSKKQQSILECVFGLDRDKMTYQEVADMHNTSQSNIRKIKQRALESLNTEEIKDYLKLYYEF